VPFRKLLQGRPGGIRSTLRQRFSGSAGADDVPVRSAPVAAAGAPDKAWVKAPEGYEAVISLDELADGAMAETIVSGRAVAVARVGDNVYALDNACPHAGGPIGDGTLEGTTVTCPFHGWAFDVTTGACHVDASKPLATYATTIVEGTVCVQVS
jgi:nitrite reductase (NADH) small subunit